MKMKDKRLQFVFPFVIISFLEQKYWCDLYGGSKRNLCNNYTILLHPTEEFSRVLPPTRQK